MAAHSGSTPMREAPSSATSVHPLFHQTIVGPNINKVPTDKAVVDNVLENVLPKILGYLNSQIEGNYLVAGALTLADIAIVSNFIVYQYMGFADRGPGSIPNSRNICVRSLPSTYFSARFRDEQPFVEQMGLDRSFIARLA